MKTENKLKVYEKIAAFMVGQSPSILAECDADERAKTINMASLLLLPMIIGTISAGIMINEFTKVEHPFMWGIIYGLVIMIVDRAIISIIKPSFMVNLSRILFALLISFSLSFPLKINIFSDLITEELANNLKAKRTTIINEYTIKDINAKSEFLKQDVYVKDLYEKVDHEMSGTGGSMKKGDGGLTAQKRKKYLEEKNNLASISEKYESQKDSLNREMLSELQLAKTTQGAGFTAKIKALGRVVEREPIVLITMIIVIIIIAGLELMPLIIKISTSKNSMYPKIVMSNREVAIEAINKTNALKIEAEIIEASIPIEEKISKAGSNLAAIKAKGEVETAFEYSNALADLIVEENMVLKKLNGQELSAEVFDKLSDRISAIYDKYAENVYNHSTKHQTI